MKFRANGFTLAELLMAVTITSLIGMAVVTLSSALSNAQASTDSMAEAISSGRYAMMNIAADIRKAGLITAVDKGEMAIWVGDEYTDGKININELVLIRLGDDRAVERLQVIFPDSMSSDIKAALNISVPLGKLTDTRNVRDLLTRGKCSRYLSEQTLALGVEKFEVVVDEKPPMPQLVLVRLVVGQGAQQITLTNTAHLRADVTDCVSFVDGIPVLDLGYDGGPNDADDDDDDDDDDRKIDEPIRIRISPARPFM